MQALRRHLSWILAGWLVVQLIGIVAPVALAAAGFGAVDECACPADMLGATCPMHHGAAAKHSDLNQCRLQNSAARTDIALLGVTGGVGVIPISPALPVDTNSTPVFVSDVTVVSALVAFDSPPPRS